MEIKLIRKIFTENSTISNVLVNEAFECFILEDKDRDLHSGGSTEGKVFGKTAIPYGSYEVVCTYSNRFEMYLPLLLNVPGFEGIRIHPGNKAEDTEGCLLPGITKAVDFVGNSRAAFKALFAKIKAAEKKEKIFITITK